jgi:hypothetical protein
VTGTDDLIRQYACPDCGARPRLIARGRNVTEVLIEHDPTCPWLTAAHKNAAQ